MLSPVAFWSRVNGFRIGGRAVSVQFAAAGACRVDAAIVHKPLMKRIRHHRNATRLWMNRNRFNRFG
ncbi:MAG: hypothetical protein SF172_06670 [Burkholderiales bacterium]|nr:hypothetical protein [Burkholderiales bacterium]